MRPKKYSELFVRKIKEQKKTMTAKQIADQNNMTVMQINYILYSKTLKNSIPDIPEFLKENDEIHADEKKFTDLYMQKPDASFAPRFIEEPRKRSFFDWLLGR